MNIVQLKRHLDFLETEIGDWDIYLSLTWKEYSLDRKKRREVERWAENIINSSIDISKLILTIKETPIPDTYSKVLSSIDLIEGFQPLGGYLSPWAKFRNTITHDYLDIRWDTLKRFIKDARPHYESLIEKTRKFIDERPKD